MELPSSVVRSVEALVRQVRGDSLVGPAFASLDAMFSRQVQLGAQKQLQLRLEIFNALNRKNLQLPDSFVDHLTFGQSLAAYAPRQVQLVARFTF